MRERDRTLSIQKKKLLRTTTFSVALLVVALMVLSAAAPAININMNTTTKNENTQTETLGTLDAGTEGLDSGVNSDAQLAANANDKGMRANTRIGNVVYDNDMILYNLASAQLDSVYGLDTMFADDFLFDNDGIGQCVDDVHWMGGHWNGAWDYDVGASWVITFYKDREDAKWIGTKPGDVFAGPFTIEWADMTKTLLADYGTTSYWAFGCNIPRVCFPGCGEIYWISIYAIQDFPPQTGVGYHYNIHQHMAEFKSEYFGYPDWTDSLDVFGTACDMAFQLTAKADHDVGVTKIVHPVTGDQLCPCVPVVVEVTNFGAMAETNVPVHVTIGQTIHALDYYEEFYWYSNGPDYDWWIDTGGYLEPVYPCYGPYMFELFPYDGYTYTTSTLEYGSPIDTTTACKPVVEFCMWHDCYGSDDYVQVTADGNPVGPQFKRCITPCEPGWVTHQVEIPIGTTTFGFMGVTDGILEAYPLYIDCVVVKDVAYDETVYINLAVGETQTVTLPDYCPCQWGDPAFQNMDITVDVLACTELATDEVPGNDCMTQTVTIHIPFEHDVGAEEVIITDLGCLKYNIKGVIRNYGQYEECCFKVYADIYDGYWIDQQFMYEQFTSPTYGLPAGWTSDRPYPQNWYIFYYYNWPGHASGDNILGMNYYPSFVGTSYCASPAMNTVGFGKVSIKFDYYLNNWGGPFDLYVVTDSGDGIWDPVWNLHNPTGDKTEYNVEIITSQNVGSSTFRVGFLFSGDSFNLDYWFIDNVRVSGKQFVATAHLFSDWYCIDTIDICENQTIDFGDYTFDIDPGCGSHDYLVCIKTALCDPMDDNPVNDELCQTLTVVYEENKAIEITKPETKAEVILFSQAVPGPTEWYNAYTSDSYGYLCYDDFENVAGKIGMVRAYGFPLLCCWTPSDPADMTLNVGFYDYNGGVSPGAQVQLFNNLAYTYTDLGDYGLGSCFAFDIMLPSQVSLVNGWVSVQSNGGVSGATWFLWVNSDEGDNNAYQNTGNLGNNLAFQLIKTWPDIWLPMGEQEFCAKVTNIGTFDNMDDPSTICDWEGVFVNYTLWLIVPPECPDCEEIWQLAASGSEKIELPCGESYTTCFTYDFTQCGAYYLEFYVDVPNDCDWTDNVKGMDIGVDTCAPLSSHTTNPAAPNGCNNWFTSDVKVIITAEDGNCDCDCPISELASIHYILNDGDEVVKEGKDKIDFMITTEGINLVTYWAVDVAGNVGAKHVFEVAIDKTKPYVDLIFEKIEDGTLQIKFTAVASDAVSGIDKVEFYIDAELKETLTAPPFTYTVTWDATMKTKTFKAKVYDGACLTAEDTVFGGDIDTVRSLYDALAQSHPLAQTQTNIR